MDRDIGVLPLGAWLFGRPTEVHTVPRHEGLILLENQVLQLPILPTCLAEPADVETLVAAPVPRQLGSSGLKHSSIRNFTILHVPYKEPRSRFLVIEMGFAPGMDNRRGLPRGGTALA